MLSRHIFIAKRCYQHIRYLHCAYFSSQIQSTDHNFFEDEDFVMIKEAIIGRGNDLNTYQKDVIEAIINKRNGKLHNLIVQPTGSGKSICFQLPILYKAYQSIKYQPEHPTMGIVITPTIALMQDQVQQIQHKSSVFFYLFFH